MELLVRRRRRLARAIPTSIPAWLSNLPIPALARLAMVEATMNTIVAAIIVRTIVEWSTVSITSPVYNDPPGMTYAVIRFDTCNQVGREIDVTYARFEWQGEVKEIEISRKPSEKQPQEMKRSVACEEKFRWITEQ